MKLKNIKIAAIALLSPMLFSCGGDSAALTEESFYVRGNCGMCEKRIESTIKEIPGVSSADWDVKSKNLTVSFDSTKIDVKTLHSAVANRGHETKEVDMDQEAHDDLPQCCQKYNHGHENDEH
ncbi:heavy-metal-associated domain-containing protein [Cytophagaceae bacterium ABcell3]|nr:heavy-metal-associated domain-containing protein [Cytophagaceae bacterium ABcell3]